MIALGARRAVTEPATLADVLTNALARPSVSPLVRDSVLVLAGAALTSLAAQVSFHAPWTTVPYTLQTGSVLLVGTALGGRRGAISMALYVLAGAIGLPVFSAGASGLAELFGFTGGYLAGFILAGAVVGWLAERRWDRSSLGMLGLMTIGSVLIYAVGVPVLVLVLHLDPWTAIYSGAIVFLPWDALTAFEAVSPGSQVDDACWIGCALGCRVTVRVDRSAWLLSCLSWALSCSIWPWTSSRRDCTARMSSILVAFATSTRYCASDAWRFLSRACRSTTAAVTS